MEQNRGSWYLLTGLILGLVFGLVYSWMISPVTQIDTHPNLLRDDYKDIYRLLISRAYRANLNLLRAEARLELIGDEEPVLALAAQAQRFLAESNDNEMALILANLSSVLQTNNNHLPSVMAPATITPAPDSSPGTSGETSEGGQGSSEETPQPTIEIITEPTPSPTNSPPFILQNSWAVCDPSLDESLIQITATDASGNGIPGVTLEISLGSNQEEIFYTGLKPELGLGYADFSAEPGLIYQLEIPESGLIISDIEVPTCQTESEDSYWGSWEIYITHPN
jgi:hypothetical protein